MVVALACAGSVRPKPAPMNGIRCSTARTFRAGPSRSPSIRWAKTTPTPFASKTACIKVGYDKYGKFDGQFGHLYSNQPYSNYILRLEYKIAGSAIADSPPWAKLNSGVMVHSQSPLSMDVEQAFPVSMEFQFLSVGASAGRQTGNVCTPGTNLEMKGKCSTDHIIDSSSKLFPLDEWVTAEIEVHGNDEIIHRINGVEVLRYQHPQLDPRDARRADPAGGRRAAAASFRPYRAAGREPAHLVPQHPDQAAAQVT